jgi:hypothetical protein
MNHTYSNSPGTGGALQRLGIGPLAKHAGREHGFITIHRVGQCNTSGRTATRDPNG